MTGRIEKLKKMQRAEHAAISVERLVLATEAYKKYAGEPIWVFRAHVLQYVLEHKQIVIREGELLLGSASEKLRAGLIFPEYNSSTMWLKEQIPTMPTRPTDPLQLSEAEIQTALDYLDYWDGKSTEDIMAEMMPQDIVNAEKAGVFKSGGRGLASAAICMDYERMLAHGLRWHIEWCRQLIQEAYETPMTIEKERKVLYWQGVCIALEAAIAYAKRNAQAAEDLAEKTDDEKRKKELLEMARICRQVPEYPPETFYEAIQYQWMLHVIMHIECNSHSTQSHRFDLNFYPLYQKDLAEGRIDRDGALELIEQLMLKIDTLFYIGDNYYVKANSGLPTWQVMSICGTDENGNDVSNELSEIILDAGYEMRLSNPPLAVRYSPRTSEKVIDKAMRLVQAGTGNPAFFNDELAMQIVRRKGANNKEAHDWSTLGCIEPHPGCGHSDGSPIGGYVSMPKILEVTLHNGTDPVTGLKVGPKTGEVSQFTSMEDVQKAFETQMYHFIKLHTKAMNATMSVQAQYLPCIYSSIFVDDCIQEGKTIQEGGSRHKYINFFLAGCGTLADSLAAIQYAVFEQKKLSLPELVRACDTDFDGQEPLRQYLINKAPKFGNDIETVDQRIAEIEQKGCEFAQQIPDHRGGWYSCGNMSQTHNVALGSLVGATPDGRKAFTFFSDNGSPMNGRDTNGPTAAANSVAHMKHLSNYGGTLYNIRFDSRAVQGEKGRKIIEGVFTGFCKNGGYHIQANVVDNEVLLAAQKNPENYRDLVVRVSGYLAYFTELDRIVQDSIIGRSIQLADN